MAGAILLGLVSTLFTYFLTALGAAGVYVLDTHGNPRKTEIVMAVAVGLMMAAVMELVSDGREEARESSLPATLEWVPQVVGAFIACLSLWGFDVAFAAFEGDDGQHHYRAHEPPSPADGTSSGLASHGADAGGGAGAGAGSGVSKSASAGNVGSGRNIRGGLLLESPSQRVLLSRNSDGHPDGPHPHPYSDEDEDHGVGPGIELTDLHGHQGHLGHHANPRAPPALPPASQPPSFSSSSFPSSASGSAQPSLPPAPPGGAGDVPTSASSSGHVGPTNSAPSRAGAAAGASASLSSAVAAATSAAAAAVATDARVDGSSHTPPHGTSLTAARRGASSVLSDGFSPVGFHIETNANGETDVVTSTRKTYGQRSAAGPAAILVDPCTPGNEESLDFEGETSDHRLMLYSSTPLPTPAEVRKARLLVFALAVQHIPEALACGVAFAGAADPDNETTMGTALSLTLAIGLQDIPEGMTAAFVLRNLGMSKGRAFFWGQMTGVVQPIAGLIGAAAVLLVKAILPYALGFAGASMLFVIIKDMVPDIMKSEEHRTQTALIVMAAYCAMLIMSALIDSISI